MAAAIKALNARIRANPVTDYVFSTHFWGPVSNFGIPIAAVMDTQKDPEIISGPMTFALIGYSATFMRYAMAVTPRNYLLFGCHLVNFGSQNVQAYRYMQYHHMGGKELAQKAKAGAESVRDQAREVTHKVAGKAEAVQDKVKS